MTRPCPVHGVRHIHIETNRCGACDAFNKKAERAGKAKLKLADLPLPHNHDAGYTITKRPDGTIRKGALVDFLRALEKDPVRQAEIEMLGRRPTNVSKYRFGAAARAAGKEPMLTANADTVSSGLDGNVKGTRPKTGACLSKLVVKPRTLRNAKGSKTEAFWGDRLWSVLPLKYARGYIIVTDCGDFSKTFMTLGELKNAVIDSGWLIIRETSP